MPIMHGSDIALFDLTIPKRGFTKLLLLSDISGHVQERRRSLGFTQKQLASMAGVSERLVRSIESGQAQGISLDKLESVLSTLGFGLALTGTDESNSAAATPLDSREDEYEMLLQSAVSAWQRTGGNDE